jgi:hypothetical protein
MTGLKYPLDFDTHYSTAPGSLIPDFTSIQVNGSGVRNWRLHVCHIRDRVRAYLHVPVLPGYLATR